MLLTYLKIVNKFAIANTELKSSSITSINFETIVFGISSFNISNFSLPLFIVIKSSISFIVL